MQLGHWLQSYSDWSNCSVWW